MVNAFGERRSSERHVAMTFRMTSEERAQLQQRAREADMTQQQLFELLFFGTAKPVGRYGRPRKTPNPGQGVLSESA